MAVRGPSFWRCLVRRPVWPAGGDARQCGSAVALLRAVLVLLGLALAGLAPDAAVAAERRVALVIGNAAYTRVPALANARTDAEAVTSELRDLGFEVMLRSDVQKSNIRDVLKDFSELVEGADTALVFYAGHAMQYRGEYYLMPVDSSLEGGQQVRFDMISAAEIARVMEDIKGVQILIFDACRNDPAGESHQASAPVLQRGPRVTGQIVAFSTAPFGLAEDGGGWNSPFTSAFVEALRAPGLPAERLFDHVGEAVRRATDGRQSPEVTLVDSRDYVFNRAERPAQKWAGLRFSDDAGALREFAELHPDTPFAADARFRADMLDAVAGLLAEERRRAEACRREADQLGSLDAAALRTLQAGSACPANQPAIAAALAVADAAERETRRRLDEARRCALQADAIEGARASGPASALEMLAPLLCDANRTRFADALAVVRAREVCQAQATAIDQAMRAGDRAGLEAMAPALCSGNRGTYEKAVADLREQERCTAQATAIDRALAAGDGGALEKLAPALCPDNRPRHAQAVAAVREGARCTRQAAAIDAARTKGDRPALEGLGADLCEANRSRFEQAAADLREQERCTAQATAIDRALAAGDAGALEKLVPALCPDNRWRHAQAVAAVREGARCTRQAAAIDAAQTKGDRSALEGLGAELCEANRSRFEQAVADLREQERCTAQATAIDRALATGDGGALEKLAPALCSDNRPRHAQALAAVREGARCTRQAAAIDAARTKGDRPALEGLGAELCEANRSRFEQAVAEGREQERCRGQAESIRRELAVGNLAGLEELARELCPANRSLHADAVATLHERERARCAGQMTDIDRALMSGNRPALERMGTQLCPANRTAWDQAVTTLGQQEACQRDRIRLDALVAAGDGAALRREASGFQCAQVRTEAEGLSARLTEAPVPAPSPVPVAPAPDPVPGIRKELVRLGCLPKKPAAKSAPDLGLVAAQLLARRQKPPAGTPSVARPLDADLLRSLQALKGGTSCDCPNGQTVSETGICEKKPKAPADCPKGQTVSKTGRCEKKPKAPADCPKGQTVSKTGRCEKKPNAPAPPPIGQPKPPDPVPPAPPPEPAKPAPVKFPSGPDLM